MEINIGGSPIKVSVPFSKQEQTRHVEEELNSLLESWKRSFPKRSERELLAMMLYQYASYYRELTDKYREAAAEAEKCLNRLNNL